MLNRKAVRYVVPPSAMLKTHTDTRSSGKKELLSVMKHYVDEKKKKKLICLASKSRKPRVCRHACVLVRVPAAHVYKRAQLCLFFFPPSRERESGGKKKAIKTVVSRLEIRA